VFPPKSLLTAKGCRTTFDLYFHVATVLVGFLETRNIRKTLRSCEPDSSSFIECPAAAAARPPSWAFCGRDSIESGRSPSAKQPAKRQEWLPPTSLEDSTTRSENGKMDWFSFCFLFYLFIARQIDQFYRKAKQQKTTKNKNNNKTKDVNLCFPVIIALTHSFCIINLHIAVSRAQYYQIIKTRTKKTHILDIFLVSTVWNLNS